MKSLLLAAAFLLTPVMALADHHGHKTPAASHDHASMHTSPVARENAEAMDKMHKAMMTDMTGDADKDFAAMMIPHHEGAIDMARIQLKYGKNPELRALAEKIITAQEEEIVQMKKWQAAH